MTQVSLLNLVKKEEVKVIESLEVVSTKNVVKVSSPIKYTIVFNTCSYI